MYGSVLNEFFVFLRNFFTVYEIVFDYAVNRKVGIAADRDVKWQ